MNTDYCAETREIIIHNTMWLRKHYELTKEKMAEILCLDIQTVNEIEKGNITDSFTIETLFRMQKFFCIDVKILIG